MSVRYLKKVLNEQEASLQQHGQQDSSDDLDSPESSAPSRNLFDLLNNDDEEHEHDEEEESVLDDESLNANHQPSPVININSNVHSSISSKSKKKKKKKSKADRLISNDNSDRLSSLMMENLATGVESTSIEDVPSTANSKPANGNGNYKKQFGSSVLHVDPKFLSAENELRRIFGSKVVNSFEKSHQAGSSRQARGGRRGSHSHRRTILVSPSEHWPRWDGSLSMELLETKEGVHYFRYVHTSNYAQAQRTFEAAKALHDLNGIASILLHHPYHIDSLISLAEYFKFTGEHQMSADSVAKCLYALECAWHPMFSPLQGNCQLKFVHESNKPLFTTLFMHIKNMDRRGCHRSALEICKLLLSLDSDDPIGSKFCIDYYALRAEEYAWLERFSEEYNNDTSLWLFPNFSYSLAICRLYLEIVENSNDTKIDAGKASSSDLMKQALMLHPPVLKKLVEKVPLKEQVWNNILKNSFFRSEKTGSPSLDHLINIYVERSYLIWRLPDVQKFLRDSALSVIKNMEDNEGDARDWACVRKEAFSSEKNEYSHLLVSDFSDASPTMPPELLQNMAVDPRRVGVENLEQFPNQPLQINVPRDPANRNPLAVLFESMLPWVDYGRAGEEFPDDHHEHDNED